MNRLDVTFESLKREGKKALVGFLTAGDPDFDRSLAIVRAACEAGLDVLELGIPFSDPTADGPTIQRGSARALAKGMTLSRTLDLVREIRRFAQLPIVLFSYYNPLLSYGAEALYRDAVAAGADGILVVDLPPEESDEMTSAWGEDGLRLIRLVAPTTPRERMRSIAETAGGFLYLITRTGVTGGGTLDAEAIAGHARDLKAMGSLPVCLGFGISTGKDVAALAPMADGVVVGSALVRIIEAGPDADDLPEQIAAKVTELRSGL